MAFSCAVDLESQRHEHTKRGTPLASTGPPWMGPVTGAGFSPTESVGEGASTDSGGVPVDSGLPARRTVRFNQSDPTGELVDLRQPGRGLWPRRRCGAGTLLLDRARLRQRVPIPSAARTASRS